MNEYIYMVKGIMSEASDEEKEHYQKGYQTTKAMLADTDEASKLKAMGMLVAFVETDMFDE